MEQFISDSTPVLAGLLREAGIDPTTPDAWTLAETLRAAIIMGSFYDMAKMQGVV